MFKMLEKYSTDLEEIVRVRTIALEEERKKTENLLSQMLPAFVASATLSIACLCRFHHRRSVLPVG